MALSTSAAAKAVCEMRSWNVSNLEIQKIIYIAHMIHLGEHDRHLVHETFEAWDYGPILPTLYKALAMFGAEPVKDVFDGVGSIDRTAEKDTLERVVPFLARQTPGELIRITLWRHGAWARTYAPGVRAMPIPHSLIREEYNTRVRHNAVNAVAASPSE